jgi:nephrocystin-3
LDPDHPSVAQSLYQLGNLYTQWGKFGTAEELYQQAMEITDTSCGTESTQMARVRNKAIKILLFFLTGFNSI